MREITHGRPAVHPIQLGRVCDRAVQFTSDPSADADTWWKRLFSVVRRHYLLGTQESYSEFVDSLAGRLGWVARIHTRKVNAHRPPRSDIDPTLVDTVKAYNWLNLELHQHASRFLARPSAMDNPLSLG